MQDNKKRIAWECKFRDRVLLDYRNIKLDTTYKLPHDLFKIYQNRTIIF